jgi:hypothetical protein
MNRSALVLLFLLPALAPGADPVQTNGIGPLMETARFEGRAFGTLGGEVAARLHGMGIDEPVEVTVQRLYRLRDRDCARLRVSFDQRGVALPGETKPKDRHAEFAMNWCEGGRRPAFEEGTRPAEGEGQR